MSCLSLSFLSFLVVLPFVQSDLVLDKRKSDSHFLTADHHTDHTPTHPTTTHHRQTWYDESATGGGWGEGVRAMGWVGCSDWRSPLNRDSGRRFNPNPIPLHTSDTRWHHNASDTQRVPVHCTLTIPPFLPPLLLRLVVMIRARRSSRQKVNQSTDPTPHTRSLTSTAHTHHHPRHLSHSILPLSVCCCFFPSFLRSSLPG